MILARGSILSGQFWRELGIDIVLSIDRFFMNIVANLFGIADAFYGVFATLAGATDVFDESIYGGITSGLYAIFGVAVLFILAYNFLLIIIDPDKSTGELSVGKTLLQIGVTLLIIVLLPPIFRIANAITGSIIEQNSIAQIIFGTADLDQNCIEENDIDARKKCYNDYYSRDGNDSMCESETDEDAKLQCYDNQSIMTGKNSNVSPMNAVLIDIFSFFYEPDENVTDKNGDGLINNKDVYLHTMDRNGGPYASDWVKCPPGKTECTLQDVVTAAKQKGKYSYLFVFASNYHHNSDTEHVDGINFHFFLGVVSAIYIIYILVLFSFDLAVRVIKIGFYQIVAPLCVACRIMPGPKKEIFKKWKSLTIKEYCLVFIRVFALCLGIFIISVMGTLISRVTYPGYCGAFCKLMVRLFLVLGILTFVKQMPKVIDDLLGGDTGLTSTVRDKLKEAAAGAKSLAAAPLGAAAAGAAGVKGAKRGWDRFKKKKAERQKAQKELDKAKKGLAYADKLEDPKERKEALAKAADRYNKAKKANKRARRSMVSSFAGIGAGTLSSMGRSASRSIGLSEAIADVAKDFTAARVNAEGSAKAAMNAAKRREGRVRNFQDWVDKHEEYQKAGGYKAWKNKQEQLEQKKKELAVAMDAVADQVDEINNRLKDKKAQLSAAATAVAEGTDKKTKVTAKVEAAKAAVEKAGERVTSAKATLDDLTVQRAELEASVMSYPEGAARDRVLQRIVDIDSQISAANKEVQNATNEQTTKETEYTTAQSELATAESELTALTSQHSTLESELQDIERELETVTSYGGLAEQVEQLTSEVEYITNLRNTSAKANLVIQGIRNNISGSGSAAAEAEARVLKIMSAADSDALDAFEEIGNKHDKKMQVTVVAAADKVYGESTPASELMKELSIVPGSNPPTQRTRDEYRAIEAALSRAISNDEFADVIRSFGGTPPATEAELTQLRSTVQSKMPEFQTKHKKDEFAQFYDEVLEFQRTGKTDGQFGAVIRECMVDGKPNPEFQSAITAILDRADTYAQVSPELSGATGQTLKDFHDNQETLVGTLRAGSQGVHTTEMKDEIFGNNEKKS